MKIIKRELVIFVLVIGLLFIFSSVSFAASINLNESSKTTISDYNEEYQIKVNMSIDTSDGTLYYLRGVFYQIGTNNYCGLTWNGTSWFSGPYSSGEGWKNFLPVTIASSSATILLKAKLDGNDNGCRNSGTYNFKVQRFTQNGSGDFDTQNEQTINVNLPTPTPTLVPTSVPVATSVPSNTPKPSSTLLSTPTKAPTPKITISPKVYGESNILGDTTVNVSSKATPTSIDMKIAGQNEKSSNLAKILIGIGGIMIVGSGVWMAVMIKRQKKNLDFHP